MNPPKGYLADDDKGDDSRDIPKFEGMVTFQGDFVPIDECVQQQDAE